MHLGIQHKYLQVQNHFDNTASLLAGSYPAMRAFDEVHHVLNMARLWHLYNAQPGRQPLPTSKKYQVDLPPPALILVLPLRLTAPVLLTGQLESVMKVGSAGSTDSNAKKHSVAQTMPCPIELIVWLVHFVKIFICIHHTCHQLQQMLTAANPFPLTACRQGCRL